MMLPNITTVIGQTPLIELRRISAGLPGRIAVKLESQNPAGSVKDRIGIAMVEDAEKKGLLEPGATIVEATSGNTGIALAFIAAARGYRLVLTMPERMSKERVSLLRFLGAEVVLTPGTLMREAVSRAQQIAAERPGSVQLLQFENPANPAIHQATTGPEIWESSEGRVSVFVTGVGTGGTITGVGEFLKSKNPACRVIAVEPEAAAVLSGRPARNHMIQGIGAGFVPPLLNRSVVDEVLTVSIDDAFSHARRLAREEGILAGISSGASLAAALTVAARRENEGKLIVTLVYDSGERYLTTPLISELVAKDTPR
jgi:cysteine synthase